MKQVNKIKVQIEYKNALGMSVIVNKKVSDEELALLEEREDVNVIRVTDYDVDRIA